MKRKYSKALLEPIVKRSKSTSDVMRALGLALSGGTNSHLKRLFKKFEIDISHFTGSVHNKGKPDKKRIPFQEVLVFDRHKGRRENTYRLRRALLESGVSENCNECGLGPEYNNKSLVLEIDHRDGNGLNNLPHNVRFLCPNCHSQTPNFGIKNRKVLSAIEQIQREEDRRCWAEIKKAINTPI